MIAQQGMTPRRAVLRGGALGAIGLAGAALLGCRSNQGTSGGAGQPTGSVVAAGGAEVLPLTAPVAQGTPRKGGTFSFAFPGLNFTQRDSHTQLGASEWHVISEKTIEINPRTAELQPSVATSWEVPDPKGLTLVLKVKPGLKMQNVAPWNGRDFNAQDLAWNLERIGGLYADRLKIPVASFQRSSMVQNITKAEAIDPLTVRVTLAAPNSAFFAGIGENRTMLMPREMDDIGYSDPMKFGSMGPYQITEVVKDVRTRYKRFDGYSNFRAGEPWFDEFVNPSIPDISSAIAAFISNQTQFLFFSNPSDVLTVRKGRPEALLYEWIDSNWNHMRYGMGYAPFKDLRVRKAIHLSTDYQAIGDGLYGSGWGLQGALNPGWPEAWKPSKVRTLAGYNPDTKQQDRAEAAKMLTAAGFPGGKGLEWDLMFPGSTNENAERFQAQMKVAHPDMKVALRPFDQPTYATKQAASEFQGLSYTITCVPEPVLEMISQYRTGGSRNYGKFSEPALDALLDKAVGELNRDARTRLLEEFQQKWVDDWRPLIVFHANAARHMVQGNIGGYDKTAGTWYGYSFLTKIARWHYVDK